MHRRPRLLVQHRRDQPQHVHRREHDRDRADHRVAPALLEDAREDRELARERRRARHRERDHAGRHQHGRQRRPPARHAAEQVELARRRAPLDRAGEQEQRRRDQPVVDHLEHGAVEPEVVRREQAERDQAELRQRRVRDHAADVRRAEREQRPVDEPDRGQHEDRRPEVVHADREQREADPQEAERGRLRDHAREDGRDLRRRLAVGVRQPAVEREQRRLDDERGREAEEEPVARRRPAVDHRERPGLQAVDDHRREHQQRAGHRVDDELDRRRRRPGPPHTPIST